MPPEKRVNPQVEVRDEEAEGGVTVMQDLVTGPKLPEVEVDRINEPQMPPTAQGIPMVVIRVSEPVEDMSYVASGRAEHYTFEAGQRYRVPVYIAQELENIGKLWH